MRCMVAYKCNLALKVGGDFQRDRPMATFAFRALDLHTLGALLPAFCSDPLFLQQCLQQDLMDALTTLLEIPDGCEYMYLQVKTMMN